MVYGSPAGACLRSSDEEPDAVLKGLKVLAVEQYGAGPFATQFLADMGAEVIKIENPADGGDMARAVGPQFRADLPDTAQSVFFQSLNRGKKSLTLNLAHPEGRALFRRLAAQADAVTSNLRGDVPGRLGITYADLADVNPRIVCAHLTAYGRTGERVAWPGYDFLMQAEAGYFSVTGEPGSAPARAGLSLIDFMTGALSSMAMLAGVLEARATGQGRDVDVSLFDLALFNLNYLGNWYLNDGTVTGRQPRSAHASITPCQSYRTKDGWIFLMCNKEKFWGLLCERVGRPQWKDDARFVDFKARLAHRDLLTELLDEALMARTTAAWLDDFAGRIPASPIYDIREALDNPFVAASDRIAPIALPSGESLRLLAPPIRYAGRVAAGRAPALGEHSAEILAAAGVAPGEIARLRALGVV
jgi:crotonobetainyl-CoA:carnitine CoA-transferase CaiB-like acyl-CoA transferase